MKVEKMNYPNEGIKCVVNSCYYYMQETNVLQKR